MVNRKELEKCLPLLSMHWEKQNNIKDKKSCFIYSVDNLNDCIAQARKNRININYALHRWYNFQTSKECENIFVKYGAEKEKNETDHEVDVYIDDIPYDIKLTVYPKELERKHIYYDLNTREGKDALIRWMYRRQTSEAREHFSNKIFIVCCGESDMDKLFLKSDFEKIEEKVNKYFNFLKENNPNQVRVTNDGKQFSVYAELLNIV